MYLGQLFPLMAGMNLGMGERNASQKELTRLPLTGAVGVIAAATFRA